MSSATSGVRRRPTLSGEFAQPASRSRVSSYTSSRAQHTLRNEASEWLGSAVNVLLAAVALIISLPVMLVIAVLIKLTSRGSVFYTQERVGLDRRQRGAAALNHRRSHDAGGRPFTIYKFRTMRVDAEQHSGAVWAQQR